MKKLVKSVGFALQGFVCVLKSERNMKIHSIAAVLTIILGLYLRLEIIEWAVILLCISSVFAAEILNTVIEKYLDTYHPEFNQVVGRLKDMSAAAVLVFSMGSALIGCLIFYEKIIELL
ncbi:MAG: diacylglycerol kinase family protein [Flavobacteriaceae bacterium]|nr:diacylglycerol kinase family protein [Flavobacteriaceae bacterium]